MRHIDNGSLSFALALLALTLAFASDVGVTKLTGAANFRDIGGYRTADGRRIKPREIYRSGELSGLTSEDAQALASLHIRYEIDLRTDGERAHAPSRWGQTAPQVIAISVGQPAKTDLNQSMAGRMDSLKTAADTDAFMEQTTQELALRGAPQIGAVLRDLAKGDEPALIHCTAGKDRTGVTVAVLMAALGVPREEVYTEYAKSNQAVSQQAQRMKAREKNGDTLGLSALPPAVRQTLMGAKPSYIQAAFRAIDAQYGSFDAYEAQALKITPEQTQSLRDKLLER